MSHGGGEKQLNMQKIEKLFSVAFIIHTHPIESIKTTSMEDVNTRVLEQIKNI